MVQGVARSTGPENGTVADCSRLSFPSYTALVDYHLPNRPQCLALTWRTQILGESLILVTPAFTVLWTPMILMIAECQKTTNFYQRDYIYSIDPHGQLVQIITQCSADISNPQTWRKVPQNHGGNQSPTLPRPGTQPHSTTLIIEHSVITSNC